MTRGTTFSAIDVRQTDEQGRQVRFRRGAALQRTGVVRPLVATILDRLRSLANRLDPRLAPQPPTPLTFNLQSDMLPRVLEPEVMDTAEEAADYDAMDHAGVNRQFVDDLLGARDGRTLGDVLDVGTGTAQIPIELARRPVECRITAIDLASEMLAVARRNVTAAGLRNVTLELVDAKGLPYPDASFDVVMSNSIVHHIPNPDATFAEMRRVVRPGGLLFVRDLLRPDSSDAVEQFVTQYAGDETPHQQQLFRQSLHASLTLEELRGMVRSVGIDPAGITQTSDRHWTLVWQRPVGG